MRQLIWGAWIKIGGIASSVDRMDKRLQNWKFLKTKFGFVWLEKSKNLVIFWIGEFQEFLICKISMISKLDNFKNL